MINSLWFQRTSIILILNKIDVFKIKLPKVCYLMELVASFSLTPVRFRWRVISQSIQEVRI